MTFAESKASHWVRPRSLLVSLYLMQFFRKQLSSYFIGILGNEIAQTDLALYPLW